MRRLQRTILCTLLFSLPLHAAARPSFFKRQIDQFKRDLMLVKKYYLARTACDEQEQKEAPKSAERLAAEATLCLVALAGLCGWGYATYAWYSVKQEMAKDDADQDDPDIESIKLAAEAERFARQRADEELRERDHAEQQKRIEEEQARRKRERDAEQRYIQEVNNQHREALLHPQQAENKKPQSPALSPAARQTATPTTQKQDDGKKTLGQQIKDQKKIVKQEFEEFVNRVKHHRSMPIDDEGEDAQSDDEWFLQDDDGRENPDWDFSEIEKM